MRAAHLQAGGGRGALVAQRAQRHGVSRVLAHQARALLRRQAQPRLFWPDSTAAPSGRYAFPQWDLPHVAKYAHQHHMQEMLQY